MTATPLRTREDEHLRRFDLLIDFNYAARVCGFSGVSPELVRWTQHAAIDEMERLRSERWKRAQWVLQEQAKEKALAADSPAGSPAEGTPLTRTKDAT